MELLGEIRLLDAIDIVLVALLLWTAILGFRRSGATVAMVGFGLLGLVYLVAQRFELALTVQILRAFFAVFVIVLVVVFQEDLRRLVERLAVWGLRRRAPAASDSVLDSVVRSVTHLASSKRGALLVLPGREPLDRHLEGGVAMDARLSEPLLLSLFDPNSPGHDGAVVVVGDRITRFSVHLPLSDDRDALSGRGTRHAAALGLAEVCDALVVVVSEERGTIAVARDGEIHTLPAADALTQDLRRFVAVTSPAPRGALRQMAARWPEALVAGVGACVLWWIFVAGAGMIEVRHMAPVVVENLPDGYELQSVEPDSVTVVVEGPRNQLYLADLDAVSVRVDALLVQLGRRTFTLTAAEVDHPEGLRVLDVDPSRVRVSARKTAP